MILKSVLLIAIVAVAMIGVMVPSVFAQTSVNCDMTNVIPNASLIGCDFQDKKFKGSWMNGVDLRNADLRGANFDGVASLSGADFRGAKIGVTKGIALNGVDLTNANLSGLEKFYAAFSGANLSGADLSNSEITGFARNANFTNANLSNAHIMLDLRDATFRNANLSGATFSGVYTAEVGSNLNNVDFRNANLSGAILSDSDLRGTNLSNADLSNADLSNSQIFAKLRNANLSGANLSNSHICDDLTNADFTNADLSNSRICGELINTDFTNANLSNTDFTNANLDETIFVNADLTNSNLRDMELSNADFTNANLDTAFTDTNDEYLVKLQGKYEVYLEGPRGILKIDKLKYQIEQFGEDVSIIASLQLTSKNNPEWNSSWGPVTRFVVTNSEYQYVSDQKINWGGMNSWSENEFTIILKDPYPGKYKIYADEMLLEGTKHEPKRDLSCYSAQVRLTNEDFKLPNCENKVSKHRVPSNSEYVEFEIIPSKNFKEIPSFIDPTKDRQHYIDRYNNEPSYKEWFDENYPQYSSIYEAVGLEEPELIPKTNYGILEKQMLDSDIEFTPEPTAEISSTPNCGSGTELVNGVCQVIQTEEKPSSGGGCLIATATYDSEMSQQVQQLRELRDNQLLQTESGTAFMGTFNDIYYSFSPIIADYERENPYFKETVKIAITPMISTLSLMENANSESEVLSIGISVIMLNLGMYLGVPAIVIIGIRRRF
jgi:uncharacterized protein YjbI with pentapeptide repeats